MQGVCISACNPPCAGGERCTANGHCEATAAPPPPTYFAAPQPLPPAQDPGAETHDGFMLRFALGLGYGSATESDQDTEIDLKGLSGSFSIDVGLGATENLVIHARLADFVISDPNVSVDDRDLGSAENGSLAGFLLAPAASYYFMPANVYLTAAVGISWIGASNRNTDTSDTSDVGIGLNFDAGKEWWVRPTGGSGLPDASGTRPQRTKARTWPRT